MNEDREERGEREESPVTYTQEQLQEKCKEEVIDMWLYHKKEEVKLKGCTNQQGLERLERHKEKAREMWEIILQWKDPHVDEPVFEYEIYMWGWHKVEASKIEGCKDQQDLEKLEIHKRIVREMWEKLSQWNERSGRSPPKELFNRSTPRADLPTADPVSTSVYTASAEPLPESNNSEPAAAAEPISESYTSEPAAAAEPISESNSYEYLSDLVSLPDTSEYATSDDPVPEIDLERRQRLHERKANRLNWEREMLELEFDTLEQRRIDLERRQSLHYEEARELIVEEGRLRLMQAQEMLEQSMAARASLVNTSESAASAEPVSVSNSSESASLHFAADAPPGPTPQEYVMDLENLSDVAAQKIDWDDQSPAPPAPYRKYRIAFCDDTRGILNDMMPKNWGFFDQAFKKNQATEKLIALLGGQLDPERPQPFPLPTLVKAYPYPLSLLPDSPGRAHVMGLLLDGDVGVSGLSWMHRMLHLMLLLRYEQNPENDVLKYKYFKAQACPFHRFESRDIPMDMNSHASRFDRLIIPGHNEDVVPYEMFANYVYRLTLLLDEGMCLDLFNAYANLIHLSNIFNKTDSRQQFQEMAAKIKQSCSYGFEYLEISNIQMPPLDHPDYILLMRRWCTDCTQVMQCETLRKLRNSLEGTDPTPTRSVDEWQRELDEGKIEDSLIKIMGGDWSALVHYLHDKERRMITVEDRNAFQDELENLHNQAAALLDPTEFSSEERATVNLLIKNFLATRSPFFGMKHIVFNQYSNPPTLGFAPFFRDHKNGSRRTIVQPRRLRGLPAIYPSFYRGIS